jgi:hypothetical protein
MRREMSELGVPITWTGVGLVLRLFYEHVVGNNEFSTVDYGRSCLRIARYGLRVIVTPA